uniref:Uncharacterized protein AlNc14C13G1580 n=1 Tax=Albugo laibachii Nc14 TaxID=890382 RepID=F0W3L9_9STRA|nr:hypothetical protein PITG_05455 [Albugo laibachii Nc14]CCA16274.1 hypothetical protein PITG_05455 [Albugo laibachii Nc14]|eukprot:CCA16274.1 hypothetical protein PITG_05455 [Albugo laibachii Nc14]
MEISSQRDDANSPESPKKPRRVALKVSNKKLRNTSDTVLIAAISENRSRELGIAMIDLLSPHELLLWNIIDSAHYVESISLLEAFQPKEILVVETLAKQRVNGEIANRLAKSMCKIIPLARKYFEYVAAGRIFSFTIVHGCSQTKGGEDLKRVMTHCSDLNITRDYVVMAAVACLFRYIEFVQGIYLAERSIKVVVNAALNRLLMDYSTIKSLELLECIRGNSKKQVSTISSKPLSFFTQKMIVAIGNTEQHQNHCRKSALKIDGRHVISSKFNHFKRFVDPSASTSSQHDVSQDHCTMQPA